MKKVSVILAIVLVLSMMLCACGGGADKIVGTWAGEQDGIAITLTFNDDGTGSLTAVIISVPFTYTAEDGVLTLVPDESMAEYADFNETVYKIDGDKLILGEGDEVIELIKAE